MARRHEKGREFRTIDVYIDTYSELFRYAENSRGGIKALTNHILSKWLAEHPYKEESILDTIEKRHDMSRHVKAETT